MEKLLKELMFKCAKIGYDRACDDIAEGIYEDYDFDDGMPVGLNEQVRKSILSMKEMESLDVSDIENELKELLVVINNSR